MKKTKRKIDEMADSMVKARLGKLAPKVEEEEDKTPHHLYDNNWEEIEKLKKLKGYKVAICGSRHIDPTVAEQIIRDHWKQACGHFKALPAVIVSGGAKGVDHAAANIAHELTGRLATVLYADWITYGKSAGPARNLDIACNVHALILIWDGESRGSRHVKGCMEIRNKPVFEIEVEITKEVPKKKRKKRNT